MRCALQPPVTVHVGPEDMNIDWVEVSREAYELENRHGREAFRYAEKRAMEAKEACRLEQSEYWTAVAAVLRPRGGMPNNSFNPEALKRAG